jgi:hypothetical protein
MLALIQRFELNCVDRQLRRFVPLIYGTSSERGNSCRRIGALASVHSLFAKSHWTGAELDSEVKQGIVAATCPAVRMTRTGFPRESTAMLILLLRPPRERPIASSSLPLLSAGCMRVRARSDGIDDQVFKVRIFIGRGEKSLPRRPSWPIVGNV